MPFGLTNSPASFQRVMNTVLAGIMNVKALVYIDDIIVFSKDESHIEALNEVFSRLREAGLTLKASKCDLFTKEVHYLGHVIRPQGISPSPRNVAAIAEFPSPRSVKEVQSFLGMVNYYRKFLGTDVAAVAEPLTRLTRKGYLCTGAQDSSQLLRSSRRD